MVTCNLESIHLASIGATFTDRFTTDITDSENEEAWPIAGFSYVVLRKESTNPDKCNDFWLGLEFLRYGMNYYVPQILVELNGFLLAPEPIQDQVFEILYNTKCEGKELFKENLEPMVAPIPLEFYYNEVDTMLSLFSSISTYTYDTFFNSVGSSISASEADLYEPTTISSLYSPRTFDYYQPLNFDDDNDNSSSAEKLGVSFLNFTIAIVFSFIFYKRASSVLFLVGITALLFNVQAESQELRIAGFFPITGKLALYGSSTEAVSRIAVDHLNNGYAKDHNISIIFQSYDTASTPSYAVQALNKARDEFNLFGIIGAHDNTVTSSIGLISNSFLFPQISYGSRANYLSDAEEYPNLVRVIPSYSSDGEALSLIIRAYGFKKMGLIFTSDDYGDLTSQQFRRYVNLNIDNDEDVAYNERDNNEIIDLTITQFTPGETYLDSQMQTLRNSVSRVIVMLPGSVEDARKILTEADRYHLIGEDFIWFGGSFVSTSELFFNATSGETNYYVKHLLRGMTSVKIRGGHGSKFDRFVDEWKNLDPTIYSGSGKAFVNDIAPYAYDALELFLRAFIDHNFINLNDFIQSMRNIDFVGLTGHISLNENGDRNAILDFVNFRDTDEGDRGFVIIAHWYQEIANDFIKYLELGIENVPFVPKQEIVNNGLLEEKDANILLVHLGFELTHNIHFFDGTKNIPAIDVRPPVKYWSCSEKKFKIDKTGKIKLDKPGPDAENIASFYHCDRYMDCKNFSDESFDCTESDYSVVFIIFGTLAGVLILFSLFLIVFVILFGFIVKRVRVRSASPPWLLVILISVIIGYCSIFTWFGQPNAVACGFQPWLLGLSIISMVSVLVAKNLRIWQIFRAPLKRKSISDLQVLVVWLIMVLPAVFILFLWTLISTPTAKLEDIHDELHFVCNTGGFTGTPGGYVFFGIFVAYTIILLLTGAIVSFLTRNVPTLFNESNLIAISIYNLVFLAVIIVPVYFVLQGFNPFVGWIIRTVAILYGFTTTVALLFIPKVWGLIFVDKGRETKSVNTQSKSNSTSDQLSLSFPATLSKQTSI